MSLATLRELLGRPGVRHTSPFVMLGDPTPDRCVELCRALVGAGAPMLELGIPYADPSADGPAVQMAGLRARSAGVSTDRALQVLAEVRSACPDTPCNLLVYGNLLHARGYARFCRDAVAAGASSLLVPDVPLDEGTELRAAAAGAGLGNVLLAGPRTPPERLRAIAAASDAFVYLAGHQGITGQNDRDRAVARADLVRRVVAAVPATTPICVGFGLCSRADVASVHGAGARIAVVGSHLLRVLARALQRHSDHFAPARDAVVTAFRELLPADSRPEETPSCS